MARKKRDPAVEDIAKRIPEHLEDVVDDSDTRIPGVSVFPTDDRDDACWRSWKSPSATRKKNDKSPKEGADRRNGYTAKTVRTSAGEVPHDVPATAIATFEPAALPWAGVSGLSNEGGLCLIILRARHVAGKRHSRATKARDIRLSR